MEKNTRSCLHEDTDGTQWIIRFEIKFDILMRPQE